MRELWFRLQCWWYGYDPNFVREVLEADAAPPEIEINNIDDLIAYLDEE